MLKISFLTFFLSAVILLAACGKGDDINQSAPPQPPPTEQPAQPQQPYPGQPGQPGQPQQPYPGQPGQVGGGQCTQGNQYMIWNDSCRCQWAVNDCSQGQQIEQAIRQYGCNNYKRLFGY